MTEPCNVITQATRSKLDSSVQETDITMGSLHPDPFFKISDAKECFIVSKISFQHCE